MCWVVYVGKLFIVGYILVFKEKGYLGNKVEDIFEWIDCFVYIEIDYLYISVLYEFILSSEENCLLVFLIIKYVNYWVFFVGIGGFMVIEVVEVFEKGLVLIMIE